MRGRSTVAAAQAKVSRQTQAGECPSVTANDRSKAAAAGDFVPGGDVTSADLSLPSRDRWVDLYLRREVGTDSPMYLAASGSGSTGWTAVPTSSLRFP